MTVSSALEKINSPADLAGLSKDELTQLAGEIRSLIIGTVSRTGGHLAANLGAVELTIALLRVFAPPRDKILWDVSHQTYAYKILTGRRDRFATLRQYGGISGFLRRDESEYDVFGAGHSGTALSAALGMAVARDRAGGDEHIVAVVGDGSAGNGIVYEALNNVAASTGRVVVVLNDNEMSIAANVGSMSAYLGKLLANPRYNRWKKSVESVATTWLRMGWLRAAYYRVEEAIKGLFLRSVMFEEFGLRYIGPVDGHNLDALIDSLRVARDYGRPILVHVTTRKGRGYLPAEEHPEKWHGTSAFDVATGEAAGKAARPSYSEVFGAVMQRLAAADRRVVLLTAAMRAGTGLAGYAKAFPDRFFDVGISEEHAVVFAAGLAAGGYRPVFAVYSTFAQRAVDCVIHDVCLQNLPVVFCLDRAGVVGDDGPTHHGVFDIALFRAVPNLTIMQPADEVELARMLRTALRMQTPAVIRYPRGAGPGLSVPETPEEIEIGKAEVRLAPRTDGGAADVWIWALGGMLPVAEDAAARLAGQGPDSDDARERPRAGRLKAGVVNARFVKPLDEELLARQCRGARVIATIEDGVADGGFGSAVAEALTRLGYAGRMLRFGWPDRFVPHGPAEVLREEAGLTGAAVARAIAGVCGEPR